MSSQSIPGEEGESRTRRDTPHNPPERPTTRRTREEEKEQ